MMSNFYNDVMSTNALSSSLNWAECRICHETDIDSNMETPCSCRGSLKYSHRTCVQRWCNEKGDTICEICRQKFEPGYMAPPPLLHYSSIPLNLRGHPLVSTSEMYNASQLIPTASSDESFLESDYDEYSTLNPRSLICCRIVAVIFVVLVVLRHTLPFIMYGHGEYSVSWLMLLMLQSVAILLPIYIMAKAFMATQRWRNNQGYRVFHSASLDEENELRPRMHLMYIP